MVAGEASGDLLAGMLLQGLKQLPFVGAAQIVEAQAGALRRPFLIPQTSSSVSGGSGW